MRLLAPIRTVQNVVRGLVAVAKALPQLASVDSRGGWFPIIRESFSGAWQQNITVDTTTVLSFAALYACIRLISSDVAKLRIRLVEQDGDGIWAEVQNPSYSPVLRKPNHFQNRIQFYMNWIASKLIHGNTYVLKIRDARRVVTAMYVLDPCRVRPLVAPDGSVFYELKVDDLGQVNEENVVPASEIIHDVMVPLFHPLVGVSPIRACGMAALQGLKIQENATLFFQNGSQPGGILTAPTHIPTETAERLKTAFDEGYTGANAGKVAVLGDGLKYEQMTVNATDAQMIELLKWTAENVCTAFGVPTYKIQVGPMPAYNNIEALNQAYYTDCLQIHIESIELLLDEGLRLAKDGEVQMLGTEFDLDGMMRMDTATRVAAAKDAIGAGALSPNEARKTYFGLPPVAGGQSPMAQQQYYSLEALSKRDAAPPTPVAAPTPAPAAQPAADKALTVTERKGVVDAFVRKLAA